MIKRISVVFVLVFWCFIIHAQDRVLVAGMKINRTMKIKKAVYKIDAQDGLAKPVILIEGNDIVIDFNNAELRGSNKYKNPDAFAGLALHIRNSKNVTIKNLKAAGYKVALLAKGVENLTIENCDFSYNYRKRLNSGQDKEDVSDWMSYHHNENDEWLRYGAAIYLRECQFFIIRNCRVTGGQNALMMTESNDGMIYNNDFSFNSGIGIGMYRSNRNKVLYNRVIFNVRGYSHGIYNRGQDSAGFLVYEQSSNNLFYKNNVTHGGDGLFLWAGQTTMDSGNGGCNDNTIAGNDFSYAATNGVEVTFSRNTISNNRIFECDHGIWGGYSYNTSIHNNQFRNNRIAIAIEHGQHNQIHHNLFLKDREAIRLWSREEQPSGWGYAKYRDTRSVDYAIVANSFNDNPIVYAISRTDSLHIFDNTYSEHTGQVFKLDSLVKNLDTLFDQRWASLLTNVDEPVIPEIADPADPFKGTGKLAGRKNILVTEWGPYDFRSPIIWNTNPTDTGDTLRFELMGPPGSWVIKKTVGVKNISANNGKFPASITGQRIRGKRTNILIELEYIGEPITTPFGLKLAKGRPYKFEFRHFFQPLDWQVLFFSMDTTNYNPLKGQGLFPPNVRMAPVRTEKKDRLQYAWWGGIKGEQDQVFKQFITVAETTADMPPGKYELAVTWDDAVRIYMDDRLLLDEWNPSRYLFDESPHRRIPLIISGKHKIRVEHLELGGFATLSLKIKPAD